MHRPVVKTDRGDGDRDRDRVQEEAFTWLRAVKNTAGGLLKMKLSRKQLTASRSPECSSERIWR